MPHRDVPIEPHADGTLITRPIAKIPLGGPRLEASLENYGRRLRIGVWGSGDVGIASLNIPTDTWTIRPNLVDAGPVTIALARSQPALAVRGTSVRVRPAARPLSTVDLHAPSVRPEHHADGVESYRLPWGSLAWRQGPKGAVISGGANVEEARDALELSVDQILEEAHAYARSCARLTTDDSVLGSMFAHSLHAGLAAVKLGHDGTFSGLAAGPGYSLPPRTYYRDAYWTVPALLPVAPDRVGDTLELLASGIHPDGEAPSAVITPTRLPESVRDAIRAHKGTGVDGGAYEYDWWRDHFDSPLYFLLMLQDYVAFTGDARLVDGSWDKMCAILQRYRGMRAEGSALPRKPYNERDWADNVFRSGWVTYDIGLYYGAVAAMASFAGSRDPDMAERLIAEAAEVRREANERLWLDREGHYVDYDAGGYREDHLAIDTLTTIRFGLADDARAARLVKRIGDTLESRNNDAQPYGDFGVLCCFPPYGRRADLKGKSAFAYRYHNGADWPYWDGVYAGILLDRRAPEWRYALLRWWEYGLQQGWVAPVEFYSPPYAPGATLQAWSAMPAAAVMQSGFGVRPPFRPTPPPWGESTLRGVVVDGERRDVVSDGVSARLAEPSLDAIEAHASYRASANAPRGRKANR